MRLHLQFIGEIVGREGRIDRAHIVWLVEIGIAVTAVNAAQAEHGRDALNAEQFLRTQHGGKRGVGVGLVEIEPVVEAAEHSGGVALAQLFLDA